MDWIWVKGPEAELCGSSKDMHTDNAWIRIDFDGEYSSARSKILPTKLRGSENHHLVERYTPTDLLQITYVNWTAQIKRRCGNYKPGAGDFNRQS